MRTYADAGISGLTLTARPGLRQLLADIVAGAPCFEAVLVYDVSRWGRFQDPDQAAHYEFIWREAGVRIAYCAVMFTDDAGIPATLMKHIKRVMAAEYSRDLSDKVTRSKRGLGLKGYWLGENPALGLRRSAVGRDSNRRTTLDPGERNAVKGNRVVVVPGPEPEIAVVRRIVQLCAGKRMTPNAIARALNADGERTYRGQLWTQQRVRRVLRDELYIGTRVVGRALVRLGTCQRRPERDWVRVSDAADPIISRRLFDAAQRQMPARYDRTDDQLLSELRTLLAETGRLSHNLIARDPRLASPGTYARRFGGLTEAYARVGYTPAPEQVRLTEQLAPHRPGGLRPSRSPLSDAEVVARLTELRAREGFLSIELIEVTPGLPRVRNLLRRFGTIARAYELSGYVPSKRHRQGMARKRLAPALARMTTAGASRTSAYDGLEATRPAR